MEGGNLYYFDKLTGLQKSRLYHLQNSNQFAYQLTTDFLSLGTINAYHSRYVSPPWYARYFIETPDLLLQTLGPVKPIHSNLYT